MKILALPNALKGSLSARQAVRAITRSLGKKHRIRAFAISDGGDGFMDFFKSLDPGAKAIRLNAKNAFLKSRRTSFLLLSDRKTAIIETARICGLGAAKPDELNPLGASSYGVGQTLLQAVRAGAKTIYVGLGGVACNDGGAGMAAACGAQFLDKNGRPVSLGAEPLLNVRKADLAELKRRFKGVRIIGVADVTNPLLGPKSSAKVFGPQKGASIEQVKILDKAMAAFARAIKQETGRDIAHTPCTAAAGAIAAGLAGCFGAKLILGAEFLFHKAGLEKHFQWADRVITSEGKLDGQTFCGKAPSAVLKLAEKYDKPVLFICGQWEEKALRRQRYTPDAVAVLMDFASDVYDAQKHAARYIKQICKTEFA